MKIPKIKYAFANNDYGCVEGNGAGQVTVRKHLFRHGVLFGEKYNIKMAKEIIRAKLSVSIHQHFIKDWQPQTALEHYCFHGSNAMQKLYRIESRWKEAHVYHDRKGRPKRCLVLPDAPTMAESIIGKGI